MTQNPGELVEQAVGRCLQLVVTWPAWDGEPRMSDDGRTFTPHKAVRRIADHLVDHLAEVEALLAGVATQPDEWHASALTSAADLAPFTVEDVREAEQRLQRLGRTFALRYAALDPDEHRPRPDPDPPRTCLANAGLVESRVQPAERGCPPRRVLPGGHCVRIRAAVDLHAGTIIEG